MSITQQRRPTCDGFRRTRPHQPARAARQACQAVAKGRGDASRSASAGNIADRRALRPAADPDAGAGAAAVPGRRPDRGVRVAPRSLRLVVHKGFAAPACVLHQRFAPQLVSRQQIAAALTQCGAWPSDKRPSSRSGTQRHVQGPPRCRARTAPPRFPPAACTAETPEQLHLGGKIGRGRASSSRWWRPITPAQCSRAQGQDRPRRHRQVVRRRMARGALREQDPFLHPPLQQARPPAARAYRPRGPAGSNTTASKASTASRAARAAGFYRGRMLGRACNASLSRGHGACGQRPVPLIPAGAGRHLSTCSRGVPDPPHCAGSSPSV